MIIDDCIVFQNCKNNYACWQCDEYRLYQPINKKILSPAQIKRKEDKKTAKKESKSSKRVKAGKYSKQSGRYAENKLQQYLESLGLEVKKTVMSGQLKSYAKVFGKSEETQMQFEGDRWVQILGKWYQIENKKRSIETFSARYKEVHYNISEQMLEQYKVIIVSDKYVMCVQDVFEMLLNNIKVEEEYINKPNKFILTSFAQDDSNIVTLMGQLGKSKGYLPIIFCLTLDLYKELIRCK